MDKRFFTALVIGVLLAVPTVTSAATISDFDLSAFDFDVISYSAAAGGGYTAVGTSNGIGWTLTPTFLWDARTVTDGRFQFSSLPVGVTTDNLHVSLDFTVIFDRAIDKLLVALDNDNLDDSINLGMVPTDYSGIRLEGTQLWLSVPAGGGLALFENINSFSVSHVNTNHVNDGFDFAFHAQAAPVPIPATIWIFGTGLLGIAGVRKRHKSKA